MLHLSLHGGGAKARIWGRPYRAVDMYVALSLCVLSMSGQEGISDVPAKAVDSGPVWGEGRQHHEPSPLYQLLFLFIAETEYPTKGRLREGKKVLFWLTV